MAVGSPEFNSDSPSLSKINKDLSCDELNCTNTVMKSAKKEHRKPEQQIYRPGQGLQNKNSKSEKKSQSNMTNGGIVQSQYEDGTISTTLKDSKLVDKTEKHNSDAVKTSKNVKNRRPDIQVYMPKAKVAAKMTEKNATSTDLCSSKWEEGNDLLWKKSNSHCDRLKLSEVKNDKSLKKEMDKESNINKLPLSSISSKAVTSWADCMEESDLSNSRSSPENKMCNGYSNDVHLHLSKSAVDNAKSIKHTQPNYQKSNKDDNKKPRHRRNNRKGDNRLAAADEKHVQPESETKSKSIDIYPQKVSEGSGKRNNRTVSESDCLTNEKKVNTNSLDRARFKHNDSHSATTAEIKCFSPENNFSKSSFSIDVKSEKKKREKECVLPPRFQKQKIQNSDSTVSGQCRSGGILKIPIEADQLDSPTEMLEKLHIPKMFPEPKQMFIHKQLFDPNNPSKPEIINIPAPVPPSLASYGKINPVYYPSEPLNSPYIPAPVDNGVYIPPPQPPSTNTQYRFMQPDVRTTIIPNTYIDMRESRAPVHCPIPQLNGIFPSPSHGFADMMSSDHTKKRLKPIVEKNLHEIVLLEKEMSSAISKGLVVKNLNSVKQCRWKLQLRYENIILADPKYCAEKNPEQSLWKTVYYQIIEIYRKRLEDEPQKAEEIKETLFNVILEGSMFYENLLEKQQETYGFKLTKLLEAEHVNTSGFNDQLRIVLISVQKNLIYLGDLARYKEQISQTSNYGKARSWYLKAQQIAPKNGKPYHQLALLALNTKRKLDAVYYYMRSLAASNPFLSAKESLLSLFEEAKRKYEIYEKKRMSENSVETEILENQTTQRCEIWIKNDGSSSERPAELEKNIDVSDLKKLSDVELNKRFVTSFLHVHGKLFTKVGMETFPEALNNMLKEFYFLLQRSPIPLTSSRLLQLLAINIFSVTNSSLKENGREHGGRSLLQEQALYASLAMMSLMMDRCGLLHVAHKSSSEFSNQIISDDFAQLLPSVKVWTDWMSCQKYLWPPTSVQLLERLSSQFSCNIWTSFAEFLSVLQEIDISNPVIVSQRTANCEPVMLEEDNTFAGFVPLLGAIQTPAYALHPFDKDKAKHCLRISKIQFFGDYLCGITPPYLEFDVESKKFIALMDDFSFEESFERSVLLSSDESFREENLDNELCDETVSRNTISNEFQVLKSRREALSKAREQQQKYQAQVQAVLQKHQSQRPIVLKIKPRYLVPDTNCFIDHLNLFKNILASTDFHLIIPLVVINELDGLARGTKVNEHTSSEHATRVTALSREAILFLEQQFASRHPHLRAITSKGSTLDTISFRSEEMGQNKGTNDDLILTCCLNYCKDRAENFMPKNREDPITLFREVVLLTDDRNLRVKALAHHVPVRDLLSFLQWANS